jgi:uncharacterized protein (DUF488 family)
VSNAPVLYTLGYEKRSIEEFLLMLTSCGMSLVVDVRDVAWSHKPGFSYRPLLQALARAGIGYHHAKWAGNPKALRRGASGMPQMLERYERHLDANPRIVESFAALIAAAHAEGLKACIICFEREPADCHRTILAERWARRTGGEVIPLQ